MNKIQPVTIAEQLMERLNRLHVSKSRYVDRNDFEYRQLLRDCDKLKEADACQGYVARAMAHLLTANVEQIKHDIGRAKALDAGLWHDCDFMLAQALTKLGYFSEAQTLFLSSADPELGQFGVRSKLGLGVGAINALSGMFIRADEMNLNYESSVDRREAEVMAAILRDAGVDDTEVARMMDIAGAIARDHGLRVKEQEMRIMDLDGQRFVHVGLKVDCSAREAADMVFEVSDRVSGLETVPPAVHVSFVSV